MGVVLFTPMVLYVFIGSVNKLISCLPFCRTQPNVDYFGTWEPSQHFLKGHPSGVALPPTKAQWDEVAHTLAKPLHPAIGAHLSEHIAYTSFHDNAYKCM